MEGEQCEGYLPAWRVKESGWFLHQWCQGVDILGEPEILIPIRMSTSPAANPAVHFSIPATKRGVNSRTSLQAEFVILGRTKSTPEPLMEPVLP